MYQDINTRLEGAVLSNDDGSCFVMEQRYPLSYLYGGYNFDEILRIDMQGLKRVCNDIGDGSSIGDYLFLDTETTGLSTGAGTVAFLAGTGFFEGDCFVIRQYFMRDYDDEPAMLRALNSLLAEYKGLITFNGKSFDWNLLQSRFIYNRMRPAIKDFIHIDLLFPSRRIWKLKLESCSLASIESNILGEYRMDDIPGAMIPPVYFKYLQDRDTTGIKKIIEHNKSDILSMTALLKKISAMLEDPFGQECEEYELYGLGRIFDSSGEQDIVVDCYSACMKSGNYYIKGTAVRELSKIYKRKKDYKSAAAYWENMLEDSDTSGVYGIFPLIELAKYYEHRSKDLTKAVDMTRKAIEHSRKLGIRNDPHYDMLKKRLERLKKKIGDI